jgi:PadR family transcriptional regulator, regulatory protein AphA
LSKGLILTLENAILGFLEREPMTGYDLKTRCFDAAAGHVWTADQAQVYRTLERLSERGLVRSKLVPQRGKPDRRVYRITDKGRQALLQWLRRPQGAATVRDPFLMRVFLSADLSDAEIAGLLSQAREDYQARLETLRVDAAAPVPSCAATDARGAELYRMTLGAAMSATRSVIDWIDDCTDRISRGLPPAAPQATGEGV